jgi:signal transduction histidine kinase/FixJ family two-component response regulator
MAKPLAVLIVEDSEDDAVLVTRELKRAGFEPHIRRVDTAETMVAALGDQEWDVIVADYRMPKFTGSLALELAQQHGDDIPFILVSAAVGEEVATAMMKAGARDFVLKSRLWRLGAAVTRELRETELRRRRRWADAALEVLSEAGRLLVEAPDFASVVSRAATLVVPRLADWCIMYGCDRDSITDAIATASSESVDRDALDRLAKQYPPIPGADDPWLGDAMQSHVPVLTSVVTDEVLQRRARDAEQLALLRRLAPQSLMVVPQRVHDRLMGIVVFAAQRAGRFTEMDLAVANELGARVALVIENARLSRAREEFLSTAVHEIKTPIAVLKASVQLMQQLSVEEREEKLDVYLARLDRQCNRLIRLVTEVLEVSRLDMKRTTLARRPTDLAALVERVVGEMRSLSKQHQLVIRRNDAVTADVDPDRVEQVLVNLLANAVKYSTDGVVEIASRRDRDAVVISVRDRGIGIPRDKQERIFERFYRAHAGTPHEHTSSLGVGLYLSKEFVARHGGRMWFESREGAGSTFWFSLPLQPEETR